jgi:hypothetical protein
MQRILCPFPDPKAAVSFSRELESEFPGVEPGVLLVDSPEAREMMETGPSRPVEGAKRGAALASGLSGLGFGILSLAGVSILAAGPIGAVVAGAAIGAVPGGLVGGLIGLGIPEGEAVLREKGLQDGGALVVVDTDRDDLIAWARSHRDDLYIADLDSNTVG